MTVTAPEATVARLELPRGAQVKFTADGSRWWTVQAADERFVFLSRQAEFKKRGLLRYSIIDWERGERGATNLVFPMWRFVSDTISEDAAQVLIALNGGAPGDEAQNHPRIPRAEVSYRNCVPLDIGEVRDAPSH